MYYFYIVRCKDGSLYSGVTKDLTARLKRHNQGKASKYTKNRRPVILIYKEEFDTLSAVRLRENEVKNWRKEKRERLVGFPHP